MLARWAVAALDTTTQSLTYIKPKLATRIKQLERQAARWLQQHAAYLPLLSDPTVQLARNASDGEWSGIPGDDLTRVWVPTTAEGPNRALTAAQRRLAWATANIERLAAGSPAVLAPLLVNWQGCPPSSQKRKKKRARQTSEAINCYPCQPSVLQGFIELA